MSEGGTPLTVLVGWAPADTIDLTVVLHGVRAVTVRSQAPAAHPTEPTSITCGPTQPARTNVSRLRRTRNGTVPGVPADAQ